MHRARKRITRGTCFHHFLNFDACCPRHRAWSSAWSASMPVSSRPRSPRSAAAKIRHRYYEGPYRYQIQDHKTDVWKFPSAWWIRHRSAAYAPAFQSGGALEMGGGLAGSEPLTSLHAMQALSQLS